MKIVTFDEGQGTLETFEVRKDRESGAWTIPSRDGYPADAVQQMKNAANSLVDLRILDTVFAEPSDHQDFGVVEPNLEDLNVGDEGVGRLVTFKDDEQKTLASLIIGDPVKDQQGQLYVRIPNQDPVYVVALDDTPLTTKFQDWIEEDLLNLSSIDIKELEIKDYSATVNPLSGQVDWNRNYDANLALDGSEWKLEALKEYDPEDPFAAPKTVEVAEDQKLNSTKLNEVKNALDDVKIANVVRKPEGMSANLKADKDLTSDPKAKQSLFSHGFIPLTLNGETEILSANGEMIVGLNDGVQYVLRFGNISGLSDEESSEENGQEEEKKPTSGGVNRYLLVTARVDEQKFPAPDLKPIPQSIEELEGFGKKTDTTEEPKVDPVEEPGEDKEADDKKADDKKADATDSEAPAKKTDQDSPASEDKDAAAEKNDAAAEKAEPSDSGDAEKPAEDADQKSDPPKQEAAESGTDEAPDADEAEAAQPGQTEVSGSGQATGSGQGQDPQDAGQQQPEEASAKAAGSEEAVGEAAAESDSKDTPQQPADEPAKKDSEQPKQTSEKADEEAKTDDQPADQTSEASEASTPKEPAADTPEEEQMTDEEKQELLEAEQEKITKENQRKLDERKDKIEAARNRVRELNARFADWYYVIPEDTYTKLSVKRDELFEEKTDEKAAAGPSLNLPPIGQ